MGEAVTIRFLNNKLLVFPRSFSRTRCYRQLFENVVSNETAKMCQLRHLR